MSEPLQPDTLSTRRSFLTHATVGTCVVALGAASFGILRSLAPSADVRARTSPFEVSLSDLPEGQQLSIRYFERPVIIRHRTAAEIAEAEAVDLNDLTDNTTRDILGRYVGSADDRVRRASPEGRFIAVSGVEPHYGCTLTEGGDWTWIDFCVSTHFDSSGRARRYGISGNLLLPVSEFVGPDTIRFHHPESIQGPSIDEIAWR